jgi:hypothetical protein
MDMSKESSELTSLPRVWPGVRRPPAGYDARGLMTLDEIKALPVCGDAVKRLVRRR